MAISYNCLNLCYVFHKRFTGSETFYPKQLKDKKISYLQASIDNSPHKNCLVFLN